MKRKTKKHITKANSSPSKIIIKESYIHIIPHTELSDEDFQKKLNELHVNTIEIKKKHYDCDASIERVKARTFKQLITLYIKLFPKYLSTKKLSD